MKILWIGISAIVFLTLAGVGVFVLSFMTPADVLTAAKALPQQQARAKELGVPLYAEDLRGDPVPDSENAATEYKKIVEILRADSTRRDTTNVLVTYLRERRDLRQAQKALAKHADWLPLMKGASLKRISDFRRDYSLGPDLLLPEFAFLKDAAKVLGGKAALEARQGKIDEAAETLRQYRAIAAHVAQEPLLISHLMSLAIESMWHADVRRLANERSSDKGFQSELLKLTEGLEAPPDIRRALAGEVVFAWVVLDHLDEFIEGTRGEPDPFVHPGEPGPYEEALQKAKGDKVMQDAYKSRFLETWNEVFALTPKEKQIDLIEFGKRLGSVIQGELSSADPSRALNRELFPTFSEAANAYVRLLANRELTRALLSINLYRIQQGRFPNKIEEVGRFIDPFTKGELLYREKGSSFIVYSTGPDGKDDGGSTERGDFGQKDIVVAGP